jgi:hypothetical protein
MCKASKCFHIGCSTPKNFFWVMILQNHLNHYLLTTVVVCEERAIMKERIIESHCPQALDSKSKSTLVSIHRRRGLTPKSIKIQSLNEQPIVGFFHIRQGLLQLSKDTKDTLKRYYHVVAISSMEEIQMGYLSLPHATFIILSMSLGSLPFLSFLLPKRQMWNFILGSEV